MKAILLLEDGTVFEGTSFGARGKKCGEVVFNTAMSGYQEVLTDPSYYEQIVTMTYPLIGNYGTNEKDIESRKIFVSGFVVKENCEYPSNWRNSKTLSEYLADNNIVGIEGIDTRKLVKHIRTEGAMRGIISSTETNIDKLKKALDEFPGLLGRDIVKDVAAEKPYQWDQGISNVINGEEEKPAVRFKVVALDCGIKYYILRLLRSHGCEVVVMPGSTSAEDILAEKPDGLFIGNGPGDPAPVSYAIETTRKLLSKLPIFGICLGHQILGLALGGKTYKLKFGHHGANHPVKDMATGKVEITSQNHGFCVDFDSLKDSGAKLTHLNLNDQTVEGIEVKKKKAFSVQYHPEAGPGPHDSRYLFEKFTDLMQRSGF